jgi:hypothetical protein
MKEAKKITHHPHNEHKMYLGKPNMGKTQLEGEAYALALFFLVMK